MKTLVLVVVAIVLLPSSLFSQPIEISTADQLQAIGADETSLAAEYILANDIDLAGYSWTAIMNFAGTFDGNGHIVKNLTTDNTDHRAGGLFGKALAGSVVKNVGVVDCNIKSMDYTASLVGDSFGEVYDCFSAGGSVTTIGTGNVGSFCGMVRGSSVVTNCYSIGVDVTFLTGTTRPASGVFVGFAGGSVTNCYCVGGVITSTPDGPRVGGFAGNITGTVADCYFNLDEGGITHFDSPGTTAQPGGRITDDMMQESTFVGWDFVNVWSIDEDQSYPQLRQFMPPSPKAGGPLPKNGGLIESTFVELVWTPGVDTTTNKVYISEDMDAVAQGTVEAVETAETSLVVGIPDAPLASGLTPGTTYYWRVDAVGEKTIAGDVWNFSIAPVTAYAPSPADNAHLLDPNVVLSWKAGLGAIVHYVIVGESFDEVNTAELGLGTETGETSLDPGLLEAGKISYWRVDELNGDTGEFIQGEVWSFATAGSVIDDFEVYKEDAEDANTISIFDVWMDGFDETLGNGTGAVVTNDAEPYAEQVVVHSGAQAMPFNFDNTGQTVQGTRALYSETSRTFAPPADWSGQTTLGLWYRGRSQNSAEMLTLVITDADNKTVVIENTAEQNAVQSRMWTEWVISLSGIEGIDLSRVTGLAIRIGEPDAQQAGSKGKINIDDIAVYPQMIQPVAIPVPNGDFEQVLKPGTDIVAVDLDGGWTEGVGLDAPLEQGTANFSDGSMGAVVDVPGWIGVEGWEGSYQRDPNYPNRQGGITANGPVYGAYFFMCNGGSWGNPNGGMIVSDAPVTQAMSGTYTLSVLVTANGTAATPVVLELLADGVALIPTDEVNPDIVKEEYREISRTYDAASVADVLGQDLTIRLGVDRESTGGQTRFDNVLLTFEAE